MTRRIVQKSPAESWDLQSITVTSCTTKNMLLFYNKEQDYDRSKGMGCCFTHFSLPKLRMIL